MTLKEYFKGTGHLVIIFLYMAIANMICIKHDTYPNSIFLFQYYYTLIIAIFIFIIMYLNFTFKMEKNNEI